MHVYVCNKCGLQNGTYAGALLHERIGHGGYPVIVEVRGK